MVFAALSTAQWFSVWLSIWLSATTTLTIWEWFRTAMLTIKVSEEPMVTSRYARIRDRARFLDRSAQSARARYCLQDLLIKCGEGDLVSRWRHKVFTDIGQAHFSIISNTLIEYGVSVSSNSPPAFSLSSISASAPAK
jgi:hypothetical protein